MITKSKLQILSENCLQLLYCSEKIEGNYTEELMENNRIIRQALRKIVIANEILDRMIICITGLQGTGKTTLIKNFYDLNDSDMNIAFGRGERLPVLLTEDSNITATEMYVVGIGKRDSGFVTVREKVSQQEFVELSKAEDEDTTNMYMEILVPPKHHSGDKKVSYMLLPGYEGKDDYWDTLIDFSVQCSKTAVFALSPSKMSGNDNASIMDKIKDKFGNNVIYAITHSDESKDKTSECKKTLMEILGIGGDQENRIVCTGSYTKENENKEWKEQLKKAIETYAANPSSADQKNIDYIDKIIINDLRPAVGKIKKFVTDITEELLTGFEHSLWLVSFDKAVTTMRKQYEKALDRKFKEAQSDDDKKLREIFNQSSKVKYLKKSLFGSNVKDIEESNKMIDEAMKDDSEHYRYQDAFSEAVAECTDSICERIPKQTNEGADVPLISVDKNKSNILTLLPHKSEEEARRILEDVSIILSNQEKKEMLNTKSPRDIMRVMVECATQYFGLNAVESLNSEQYITVPELAKCKIDKSKIKDNIQSTEKFALSVLGITGLDLLGDGVINFVPALAESLAIPVPAAGGIVTAIAGLGAATSIIKDCNNAQVQDYYSCKKVIASVYDDIKKAYLDIYDTYIEKIRNRVEQHLRDCAGVDEAVINKDNAISTIHNIQEDIDRICEDLRKDRYELTELIKG